MNAEDPTHMTPADVTSHSFNSRRRGLDPKEVHEHLRHVADAMRAMNDVISDLQTKIEDREAEIAAAEKSSMPTLLDLDEDALQERLDEEMQELVRSARKDADDARLQADVDAAAILAEAEQLYATRSLVADEEAARKRLEAAAIRDQRLVEIDHEVVESTRRAEVELAALNDQVASNRRDAEVEANRLVSEAQVVRRQILEDLTRRRNTARRQIEQLRAGRDRLLASHDIVRKALDEVTNELTISMVEARAAAETAGHAVSDSSTEELEAEIETARLSGLLDTGPVPVVDATPQATEPADDDAQREDVAEPKPSEQTAVVAEIDVVADPDVVTEPETQSEPDMQPDVPEPDTQPDTQSAQERLASDVVDSTDETSPKIGNPLAAVVDLDTARPVVDTGSHPAAGRNTSVGSAPPIPRLAAVAPDLSADDDDPTVEDLFARMRASRDPASDESDSAKSTPKKTEAKKKAPAKKGAQAKKAAPVKKAQAKKEAPAKKKAQADKKSTDVDLAPVIADMNRQLKRVLADEQSSVLSSLRSGSSVPDIDTLLGKPAAHQNRYWSVALEGVQEASEQIQSQRGTPPAVNGDDLRSGLDRLIEELRASVSKSLEKADNSDSMIDDLRAVYRQVKTRRIGACVEELCDSLKKYG